MKNVMLDLETLGRTAGCSIISIGAVVFSDQLEDEFYISISRESCKDFGLFEDPETLAWWESQSDDAKKVFTEQKESLPFALGKLCAWIEALCDEEICVWGNGSDFDNAMMQFAFRAIGKETPWKFWNNRCYRTLKNLYPKIELDRQGTYHNALDDAKTQALHAIKIFSQA